MLSPEASNLIDMAINKMLDEGWTKGRFVKKQGDGYCYCAAGALIISAGAELDKRYLDDNVLTFDLEGMANNQLAAYKEISSAVFDTYGMSLFALNDMADEIEDVVFPLMALQAGVHDV